jgi:hypothetical protein
MIHWAGSVATARGGPPMSFYVTACFRFGRIPVRPPHWLRRPYLAWGNPALRRGPPANAERRPGGSASRSKPDGAILRTISKSSNRRGRFGKPSYKRSRPHREAGLAKLSGNGPIWPCRTLPIDADEGKADRPVSLRVSALRPWPTANPKRGRHKNCPVSLFPLAKTSPARYSDS